MSDTLTILTFLGFGEAAQAFAGGLRQSGLGLSLRAYDIKFRGPETAAIMRTCLEHDVEASESAPSACSGSRAVFSLVTAEQAETAALDVARGPLQGALYFDCNSCAPETKREVSRIIEGAGAVMSMSR